MNQYVSINVERVTNGYVYSAVSPDGSVDTYVHALAKAPDLKEMRDNLVWLETPPPPPPFPEEETTTEEEEQVVDV